MFYEAVTETLSTACQVHQSGPMHHFPHSALDGSLSAPFYSLNMAHSFDGRPL